MRSLPSFAAAVPALVGVVLLGNCFASPLSRVEGFRQAADSMPYPVDGALILVASNDRSGEEEVVVERLSHHGPHKDVILRGTHVLTTVDDDGRDKPLLTTPEEVRAYLLQMPVRFIVLGSPPFHFAFLPLLEKALTDDPQNSTWLPGFR